MIMSITVYGSRNSAIKSWHIKVVAMIIRSVIGPLTAGTQQLRACKLGDIYNNPLWHFHPNLTFSWRAGEVLDENSANFPENTNAAGGLHYSVYCLSINPSYCHCFYSSYVICLIIRDFYEDSYFQWLGVSALLCILCILLRHRKLHTLSNIQAHTHRHHVQVFFPSHTFYLLSIHLSIYLALSISPYLFYLTLRLRYRLKPFHTYTKRTWH